MSEEGTTKEKPAGSKAYRIGQAVQRWKDRAKDLESRLNEASSKIADLEKRPSADTLAEELAKLQREVTHRDHRDTFARIAADKALGLADGVKPDTLMVLSQWTVEGPPDEAKIKGAIEKLKADHGYLFGGPPTPKEKPAGSGQGERAKDGVGAPTITRAQIKDPTWIGVPENQKAAALAIREGRVID